MTKLYRSRRTMRRVYLRWESTAEVGFAFTEHGRTYRAAKDQFNRCYIEV